MLKKYLQNERGGFNTLLALIIISPILVWLMFKPTYQHVLVIRHAILQTETDYLLESGARLGYVNSSMLTQSKQRMVNRGFNETDLQYIVTSDTGQDATNPLLPLNRGSGLVVEISYPYGNVFMIDRLLGITPPSETDRLKTRGTQMVERWD